MIKVKKILSYSWYIKITLMQIEKFLYMFGVV